VSKVVQTLTYLGRLEDAVASIKKISETNGANLDEKYISEMLTPLMKDMEAEKGSDEDSNFMAIYKYPRVLVRFVIICLVQ